MIKLTAVVSRKTGLDREGFASHYRDRHGPLVASVAEFRRHVHRYVQNYADRDPQLRMPGYDPERDGLTEIWFADLDTFMQAYQEPEYAARLRPDEQHFVDMDSLVTGIADEHVVFESGAADAHCKLVIYRKRTAGTDPQRFKQEWLERFAPQLLAAPTFKQNVRRYIQSHMQAIDLGLPGAGGYEVVDELWFDSSGAAAAFASDPATQALLVQADSTLLDSGANIVMLLTEFEAIAPQPFTPDKPKV